MSFRAIFFDIDGTLLGRDKCMPPSTLHALKKARENSVLLFVATGRVTPMTYFLRDYFDFDGFAAMTGQYCFDKNGKVLHTLAIDPEDIRLLIQLQKEEPFPCLIAEGRECFAATPAKQIEDHFLRHNLPSPPVYDISRADCHEVYQLMVYDPEIYASRILPLKHIKYTHTVSYCYDVIHENGGKQIGIPAMAAHYGIKNDEILVFGDGPNDVDMLRDVGFGVAMGNGCAKAKAAANYVTTDVDDDGIYRALKELGVI